MEFQQYLDPFGSALQYAGKALDNEGKSLQNQTNLVKLGAAQEQLDALKTANADTARAFQEFGMNRDPTTGTEKPSSTPSSLYAAGKDKGPLSDYDSIQGVISDYDRQIALNSRLAAAKAISDPKASAAYLAAAETANSGKRAAIKERAALDETRTDDLANMFGLMAESPEAAGGAVRMMMDRHPDFDPSSLEKFGFKMMRGFPVFDRDLALKLSRDTLGAKDRMTEAHQKELERLSKQQKDIEEVNLRLRRREADQREAARKDGIDEKREERAFGKLAVGMRWIDPKDRSKGQEDIPKTGVVVPRDPEGKLLTGQAYLDSLPPGEAGLVKAIREGRIDPKTLSNRRDERKRVLEEVEQYQAGYDQKKYPIYQAVQKDFASPQGIAGRNVTAINTSIGHIGTFLDLAAALDNKDTKVLNAILNKTASELGDPRINNVEIAGGAVSSEMMRIFRQVGASEKEQKEWETRFASISSPAQFRGAAETAASLLSSRIDALNGQWRRGMDTEDNYPKMLDPHSKEVLKRLGVKVKGEKAQATPKKDTAISLEEYLKSQEGN